MNGLAIQGLVQEDAAGRNHVEYNGWVKVAMK